MEFHQKLKSLREKCGLTQEELAEQLGITRQSVSKWELGINEPDLPTIRSLCKILHCSYDALLGEAEEIVPAAEPAPTPVQEEGQRRYRIYLSQFILLIVYQFVSLIIAFFPFITFSNGMSVNFFQIVFGGHDNMNLVCLMILILGIGSSLAMALLAFLPRRTGKLFRARDGVLVANVALMVYVIAFGFQTNSLSVGMFLLLLSNVTFMVLHFAIKSLRYKGFAEIYGEKYMILTPVDTFAFPSTLMACLAIFSLIRMNFNLNALPAFQVTVFWFANILCFVGLATFAVLYLALPVNKSRKGVKIGSLVTLGVTLLSGLIFVTWDLLPLLTFYWIDVAGVIVAVCLCKAPKNLQETSTDHEKTCQGA